MATKDILYLLGRINSNRILGHAVVVVVLMNVKQIAIWFVEIQESGDAHNLPVGFVGVRNKLNKANRMRQPIFLLTTANRGKD